MWIRREAFLVIRTLDSMCSGQENNMRYIIDKKPDIGIGEVSTLFI